MQQFWDLKKQSGSLLKSPDELNILMECFRLQYISFFKKEYTSNEDMSSNNSVHQGFLEGFLIAILNPKIAAWLLALFSQFVQPEALLAEQFILVSTVGVIDASWYCLVAFLASSGKLVKALQQNSSRIELCMGILLIILAAGMLWKAIPQII